jgi:HD superfamily phosphodiesterase
MKCPGQDMQYWDADAIFDVACPECAKPVEFYKDDTTRTCKHCNHRFVNPKLDFGCAAYCKYAEQCIGTLPEEFVGSQDNLLKDKVAVEMKRYYKTDFKRIGHVSRVARYAEKIGSDEGTNLAIVLCAAYLNNIGAGEAQNKHNSDDPELIKQESLAIASTILGKLGAKETVLDEVCSLISRYDNPEIEKSSESNSLNDAILLARLEDQHKEADLSSQTIEETINTGFLTEGGRQLAKATFVHLGAL